MRRTAPRRHGPLIGALAIVVASAGLWLDPRMFWASWLAAWWWCLGLVLGALTNLWMHRLTGGRWGMVLRPAVVSIACRMPWLLVLGVPLLAGLAQLYPWLGADSQWTRGIARPAFIETWLSPGLFAVRLALYAALWGWLARVPWPAQKGRAAAALLLQGIAGTLAAVDLLMSLTPLWYSSIFGLLALSVQALGGAALAVLMTARASAPTLAEGKPPVARDLGNLLLMWVMLWAYLAFMQLLIIWAENLPREIAWYVPRLQTGWRFVGLALVVVNGLLPLLALLWRANKDRPQRLAAIAAGLLAANALAVAWMVVPSVEPLSPHGWWLLPLLFAGMALLLFGAPADPLDAVPAAPKEHRVRA